MRRAYIVIIVNTLIGSFVTVACAVVLEDTGMLQEILYILGKGVVVPQLVI
jgi:hypothetical protein